MGDGKNFIEIMKSLAERGVNPTVVNDQYGRPTFTEDLAGAILHLVENRCEFGTYHVSNSGEVVTWADLAKAVFEATGHSADRVTPVTTTEYFAKAEVFSPRPTNSAMDLSKIVKAGFTPRSHQEALAAYFA